MTAAIPGAHPRWAASALTAVAGLLGVTVLLAGELTPGYDHRYDTVSRLASPGQPWATVVRSAIVALGVLIVATATTPRASIASYRRPARVLIGIAGAATVVVGIAPKGPPDVDPTTVSQLHVAASLVGVVALGAPWPASRGRAPDAPNAGGRPPHWPSSPRPAPRSPSPGGPAPTASSSA